MNDDNPTGLSINGKSRPSSSPPIPSSLTPGGLAPRLPAKPKGLQPNVLRPLNHVTPSSPSDPARPLIHSAPPIPPRPVGVPNGPRDSSSFYRHVPQYHASLPSYLPPPPRPPPGLSMDYFSARPTAPRPPPASYYSHSVQGSTVNNQTTSPHEGTQHYLQNTPSQGKSKRAGFNTKQVMKNPINVVSIIAERPPLPPKTFLVLDNESLRPRARSYSSSELPPPLPPKISSPPSSSSNIASLFFLDSKGLTTSPSLEDHFSSADISLLQPSSTPGSPLPSRPQTPPALSPIVESNEAHNARGTVLMTSFDQIARDNERVLGGFQDSSVRAKSFLHEPGEASIICEESDGLRAAKTGDYRRDEDEHLERAIQTSLALSSTSRVASVRGTEDEISPTPQVRPSASPPLSSTRAKDEDDDWEKYDPSAFGVEPPSPNEAIPKAVESAVESMPIVASTSSMTDPPEYPRDSSSSRPSPMITPASSNTGASRSVTATTSGLQIISPSSASSSLFLSPPPSLGHKIAPQLRTSPSYDNISALTGSSRINPQAPTTTSAPRLPRTESFDDMKGATRSASHSHGEKHADVQEHITSASQDSSSSPVVSSVTRTDSFLGDLMKGVSYGFGQAQIVPKDQLPNSAHPFPDVISLNTGEAFYIATPTFRQLLRLLASLGHASIEPSVNAHVAIKLPQLNLRPALQFVHVRESDYATILWLEIEVPLSASNASGPNSWQHKNGDTAVRGWRTALPQTVQHSPRLGSQLFVCQAPLPPMPRMLPDLANYLQSLLRDSRRAADFSGGLKRLSRVVDSIYKKDAEVTEIGGDTDVAGSSSRRHISGMLSRVIPRRGRGNAGSGANEETYDLVTPFRLDQSGV